MITVNSGCKKIKDDELQWLLQALAAYDVGAYFESTQDGHMWLAYGELDTWIKGTGQKNFKQWYQALSSLDVAHTWIFGAQQFSDQKPSHGLMQGRWFLPKLVVHIDSNQSLHWYQYSRTRQTFDYEQWLEPFRTMTASVKIKNSILTQQDEQDWRQRTTQLIDTLKQTPTLKKVVFARQRHLQLASNLSIPRIISRLKQQQANTYHVLLKSDHEWFVSATPERLVKLVNHHIYTAAVAGTIQRNQQYNRDEELAQRLMQDTKNRAEHQFVVQQINQQLKDLTLTLNVPDKPVILQNQQVQHLYTPISGIKRPKVTIFDFVDKLHPTPALGGMPTTTALAYIEQHEKYPRGIFAAPVGIANLQGDGELVVGIRAMHFDSQTKQAKLFAGAGILQDSSAEEEWRETDLKFLPMQQLIEDMLND